MDIVIPYVSFGTVHGILKMFKFILYKYLPFQTGYSEKEMVLCSWYILNIF